MTSELDLRSRAARWVVVRAQAGDREALDALLRAIQAPLLAHLTSIVGDGDVALDLLQDVLLLIAKKMGGLRDPRWFRAWCYRIATREALRHTKQAKRWVQLNEDEAGRMPAEDSNADTDFDADLIASVPELIATLTPASRTVVRMHYLEALTLPEIAEALEVPLGTVKSRLSYGLVALRRTLAARGR